MMPTRFKEAIPLAETRFALFDFDGTLCRGDSIVPYLRFCIAEGLAPRSQWVRAAGGWLSQAVMPSRIVSAKERSLSFIAGRTVEEMDAVARRFFEKELKPRFFADGLREIDRLLAENYHIIVISASADVYMRVLPEFLPCETVIATPCVTEGGRYTGAIESNCKGLMKYHRFLAYTREHDYIIDREKLRCYGDSPGDVEMMHMAVLPTAVNASRKLLAALPVAERVKWK